MNPVRTMLPVAWALSMLMPIAALPAIAAADDSPQQFQTPSGDIRCLLEPSRTSAPVALCQIRHHTYVVPPGLPRDDVTGGPCPPGANAGGDFRLDQGEAGFIRCTYSALGSGTGSWPVLDYGQSRTLGPISCASEPSGMRCTDISTGHYFRVSDDAYELG